MDEVAMEESILVVLFKDYISATSLPKQHRPMQTLPSQDPINPSPRYFRIRDVLRRMPRILPGRTICASSSPAALLFSMSCTCICAAATSYCSSQP